MRRSPIYDLCLAMQFVPQEFANLQVTKEEFLCMKVLMLLNTGNKSSVFCLGPIKLLLSDPLQVRSVFQNGILTIWIILNQWLHASPHG